MSDKDSVQPHDAGIRPGKAVLYVGCCVLFLSLGYLLSLLLVSYSAPRLEIDPADLALGNAPCGNVIHRTIAVHNAGRSTLRLLDIRSSCTCTTTKISSATVAAKESVDIELEIRVPFAPKATTETLYFHTNETRNPSPEFTIDLQAQPVILPAPEMADFGEIASGTLPKRIQIACKRGEFLSAAAFNTMTVETAVPYLTVESVLGDDLATVNLTLSKSLPLGVLSTEIVVRFSQPEPSLWRIPVHARLVGDYQARPDSLFLDAGPDGQPVSASCSLAGTGPDTAISIKPLSKKLDRIINLVIEDAPREKRLVASLKAGAPKSLVKDAVFLGIEGRDGGEQILAIPVVAVVQFPQKESVASLEGLPQERGSANSVTR